jgi:hypothetical protein
MGPLLSGLPVHATSEIVVGPLGVWDHEDDPAEYTPTVWCYPEERPALRPGSWSAAGSRSSSAARWNELPARYRCDVGTANLF